MVVGAVGSESCWIGRRCIGHRCIQCVGSCPSRSMFDLSAILNANFQNSTGKIRPVFFFGAPVLNRELKRQEILSVIRTKVLIYS